MPLRAMIVGTPRARWHRVGMAMAAMLACCAGACRDQSTPPAALGTPAAFVEPLDRPQMRRGDFWEYAVSGGDGAAHWAIEVEEVLPAGRFRARQAEATAPIGTIGDGADVRRVEYDGPWNTIQPQPEWRLEYLRFPLTDGGRWSSTASGPGVMTRTLTQEVKGMQALQLVGASFDCVRIEGSEATTSLGPPPVTAVSRSTLWYCPALRAVGRAETQVSGAPLVTHTLVALRHGD